MVVPLNSYIIHYTEKKGHRKRDRKKRQRKRNRERVS